MRRWKVPALLLAGALAGAMLAGVAVAGAYDVAANCVAAPLNFVFNGHSVAPQVANGNPAGFICNGTSYVPLRFVAQSMGASVAWDGTTRTITVTSAPAAAAATCTLIVDLTASGGTVWGKVTATYGSTTTSLTAASQTLSVPCGTTVSLSELPVASTWPFAGWTVSTASGATTSVQQPLQVTVSGATTVTANYTLQTSTSHMGSGY